MLLINFTHPLTDEQISSIREVCNCSDLRIVEVPSQFDHNLPFPEQISKMLDGLDMTPRMWQTEKLLINPPGLSTAAVVLMAELHGRCGYFPAIIRLRPKAGIVPVQYELAEMIDLQQIRDQARIMRNSPTG